MAKKILIISRCSSIVGGVEAIQNALCRDLPRDKWDVQLALTKGLTFNRPELYAQAYPDLPILEIDGTGGTRQARLEALAKVLKQTSPDIVLNMRVFDAYEAVARYKLKFPATRLVAGVRCYEKPLIQDAFFYRDYIDAYATSGERIAQELIALGIDSNRVMNIPGGIRPPNNNYTNSTIKEHSQVPVQIGYIGRLEQGQKRILDLPLLLQMLDERGIPFQFHLAGKGPDQEELLNALKKYIESGKLHFYGFLPEDKLYEDVYPKLDIVVHFAHTEGVTIAPREAMVHGAVPVMSNFSGLEEEGLYRHGENCLTFPVGDIDKAAKHVEYLINDHQQFSRLSQNAIQSQQGKYSYQGALQAWEDCFETALQLPEKTSSNIPSIPARETGRLAHFIRNPWLQQRIRNAFNLKPLHIDPGGEWPTNGGLISFYDFKT